MSAEVDTVPGTPDDLNIKVQRYRAALESLRTMQGEIIPAHNQEMVPIDWVLKVVNAALDEE